MFATRLDKRVLRNLKLLSAYTDQPINTLLEEAVQDLFKKYEKRESKTSALYELMESREAYEPDSDTTSNNAKGSKKLKKR